jgi:hypothetical protein
MTQRTLLQFFHWYYPDGGSLWKEVEDKAETLAPTAGGIFRKNSCVT